MIFVHPYERYEFENNPGAFRMYCKHAGKLDREIQEARYYNLRPTSTPLTQLLIGTVHGGFSHK